MRLICGILHLDGAAASGARIDAMAAAMTQRGLAPGVSRWIAGPVGLAVLDFSGRGGGVVERDGWVLAADLRLDRAAGDPEAATIDAIRHHGADFPDRLDGDFAVAAWRRDGGELRLGRDFIGVRPLAWTFRPGRWFAFASLPKGLHGAGLAARTLDPIALGSQTTDGYFTGSDTGFAEIAHLLAGHSLALGVRDDGPPRLHRAYRPSPAAVGTWRGSPEAAAATMRRLVREAVERRLPAAGPVACHLTGGLDSSTVAVLTARAAPGPVLSLAMTMPTAAGPAELDERPLIAAVLAQEARLRHVDVPHVLQMPGAPADPDWPGSLVDGADDRMMAAAAAFGADRILCGVGGDEGASYNGADLYVRLLREGRLVQLFRELAARAEHDGVPLAGTIRGRLVLPLLPRGLVRRLARRPPGFGDPALGAVRFFGTALRAEVTRRRMPPVMRSNTPEHRVRVFADHHIPSRCSYHAIMAARHGVAATFPLLDRRVVDFALSLPVHVFLGDGQGRQPFRRAMVGILPEAVRVARHKVGLYDDCFARYGARKAELLAMVAALRAARSPAVTALFDLDAIAEGVAGLPEPGEGGGHVRRAVGDLPGGRPAWTTLTAVRCLAAARLLAGRDDGPVAP